METWEELEEKCLHCDRCELCRTRHNVVFGVGNCSSRLLFVGEGPGEQEDLQGVPFVGPAGKLLDDMLSIIDLDREKCYIANIVKCRPPHNPGTGRLHWLFGKSNCAFAAEDHRLPGPHCRPAPD